MELNREEYEAAVKQLNEWTKAYDEGHPVVPDKAWDLMYYGIRQYERETGYVAPDSPTATISYQVVNELQKVRHDYRPMLSLAKTKEPKAVLNFIGSHDWIAMAKLDGLSCRIEYRDNNIYRAETRGDGYRGEDITHNIMTVKNVPKTIPYKQLVVEGEIICTAKDFESFEGEYQNSRNFAAGSIRLLDANECAKRKLSFIAWDVIFGDFDVELTTLSQKLEYAEKAGFDTVPRMATDVALAIETIKEDAEDMGYPIDGIVFKWNNCKEYDDAGRTEHHFNGGLAYKFYDELYETQLRDITWSMGRTGVLTPVALFEPVLIDGTLVEKASLHNVSVLEETLGSHPIRKQRIWVTKSNQIIPQIVEAEKNYGDTYNCIPNNTKCPICGATIDIVKSNTGVLNMICPNDNCEGKLVNKIDHYFGKKGLDVKGISKATIEKLIDWGWVNSITDMYKLHSHQMEWTMQPGFGKASVFKILDAIDESYQNVPLNKFIAAIGIPLIGTTASKQLAKYFKTWDNFLNNMENAINLNGFGYEMLQSLRRFDYTEAKYIAEHIITFETVEEEKVADTLSGKTFVITGKLTLGSRDKVKEMIEAAGGKVASAISSKTDYLINNDIDSTSTKNKKAKELGIPIINEEQLKDLLKN